MFSSSLLLSFKVWLNFIIKPTGFRVRGEEKTKGGMTFQTRLFTGLLAAASPVPASREQQQQRSCYILAVSQQPSKQTP